MTADKRRPTINDVARIAGVSKKTVSRVINNVPKVRPETVKKVEEAIYQLGFVPSLQARSLASRHSFLLGFVYDYPNAAFVYEILNSFLQQSRESGFELIVHPCDYSSPKLTDSVVSFTRQSQIDGLVLLSPISEFDPLLSALAEAQIPAVRIGSGGEEHLAPLLRFDLENDATQMTKFLLDLGHEKVGFISGHPDHASSKISLRGYKAALEDRGIPLRPEHIRQGRYTFESGLEKGRELLALTDPPTAIFAANEAMAYGVLHIAQELGISIPAELSVVGYGDPPFARQIWPPLTTFSQPIELLGNIAAKELINCILGGPCKKPKAITVKSEFKLRSSAAAPRK
jgi:LacI family transcriptional regulator